MIMKDLRCSIYVNPVWSLKFAFSFFIGFIKFLGPHYMLLITKRRKIGAIDGHRIYGIASIRVLPVQNSTLLSNMHISKDEKRSFVHFECKCTKFTTIEWPMRLCFLFSHSFIFLSTNSSIGMVFCL